MGWLKERMSEIGVRNYSALITKMRNGGHWPKRDRRTDGTIRNPLGALDTGKKVAWWLDGAGKPVLQALADALGLSAADLRTRIRESEQSVSGRAATQQRFDVFPELRPLELKTEKLFPGIPDELVGPGGPQAERTWWQAAPGAGKTVAGRWLEVREAWTVLPSAATWDEARHRLPERGRAFVELAKAPPFLDPKTLPRELRLCVASADGPPPSTPPPNSTQTVSKEPGKAASEANKAARESPVTKTEWHRVTAPPIHDWLEELVRWVLSRVQPGGGLDKDPRRAVRQAADGGLLSTPGDVLSFLHLLEEVGPEKDMKPKKLLKLWLGAALERSDLSDIRHVEKLFKGQGADLLVEIEMERLRRPLAASLTEAEWISLVPSSFTPQLDHERLADLARRGRSAEILEMVKPDARTIIRGLGSLGALREIRDPLLAIRPNLLAKIVGDLAFERLRSTPEGFAALLLCSSTSEAAIQLLVEGLRAGDLSRVSAWLTNERDTPEWLAMGDGLFRAIGFLLTVPGVSIDVELVHQMWRKRQELSERLFHDWPAEPRVGVASASNRGLSSEGGRYFAELAVSLYLVGHGREVPISLVNPSRELSTKLIDLWSQIVILILEAFEGAPAGSDEQLAPYRLGGSMLDHLGVLDGYPRVMALQTPDALALRPADHGLRHLVLDIPALRDACRRRGVELKPALEAAWRVWGESGLSSPPSGLSAEDAQLVWSSASDESLSDAARFRFLERANAWKWEWLQPKVREGLVSLLVRIGVTAERAHLFNDMPEELAMRALEDPATYRAQEMRRLLWQRMPQRLMTWLEAQSVHEKRLDGHLLSVAQSAPDARLHELLGRLTPDAKWVRAWMMLNVVQPRRPGWRDAVQRLGSQGQPA